MTDTPPLLPPEHRRLEGPLEYVQALNTIIQHAHRSLRIFDLNLRDEGYNSIERVELLRRFFHLNRSNRLVIVLHDTDFLTNECPRMIELIKRFGHAIEIYRTTEEARGATDPFVIADNEHYLHRFHYDHPRAVLSLNDKEGALNLIRRFNEIVEASEAAAPPTTLGL